VPDSGRSTEEARPLNLPKDCVKAWHTRLLKRVFDIDVERCACGGKLKLVAVIEEPAVIGNILAHLGLDPQPPPIAPARMHADLLEWA
jgi:hypothetical protein